MCDNHRECEAARSHGWGGERRGGAHGTGGHGHGLEWHGEWRGQEIVRTLIASLGVEVTVLDADDRIVAFSGGPRLFARDDTSLGESVYGCHPAEAYAGVREVLDALRAGEDERSRDVPLPEGGTACVRYVARHDGAGRYAGAMQLAYRER